MSNTAFIPISKPSITALEMEKVTAAVRSGWISSLGPFVDGFEKAFAEFCQVEYAVSVSNGTNALHLALVVLGVGLGDEVIIPDLTFVATANAVTYTGARVVCVDVDAQTLVMDPKALEKAITPKTKAIIPVHLYGHPAPMPNILKIARRHNIAVIEDAAEAHGACLDSKPVGVWGDVAIFSFYGNKNFTTGEGGMLVTSQSEINHRARYLRDHAMSGDKRYWHEVVGFNYRMTNLQAALGVAQLERAEEILEKKKNIFKRYHENLSELSGVTLNPVASKNVEPVYWMICFQHNSFTENARNAFMDQLKKEGIDSRPFFYPISMMPMYDYVKAETPVTYAVSVKGLNLPSYVDLSVEEIDKICVVIKKLLQ